MTTLHDPFGRSRLPPGAAVPFDQAAAIGRYAQDVLAGRTPDRADAAFVAAYVCGLLLERHRSARARRIRHLAQDGFAEWTPDRIDAAYVCRMLLTWLEKGGGGFMKVVKARSQWTPQSHWMPQALWVRHRSQQAAASRSTLNDDAS